MTTMDGYIRVSRVGDREGPGYISPDVQRESITAWAKSKGVKIAKWHVDEDRSGGTQDRPGLRAAMKRIEAGETGGLVCWKLDRFARNIAGAVADIETIEAADAQLVCVQDAIDTTGPFGKFIRTILLAVATLERDRITDGWAIARKRAVERGAGASPTNWGFERTGQGTLTPDPVRGVQMQRAYELAATQGLRAAFQHLHAIDPKHFRDIHVVRRTLARRVYMGEIKHGQFVNADAHEPLVSQALWEAAQHDPKVYRPRQPGAYPLSGLARCATCGAPMVAGSPSKTGASYRCSAVQKLVSRPRCPHPARIMVKRLEDYVRSELEPLIADISVAVADGGEELALAERAMVEAEAELQAFAADLTMRRALGDSYHEHLQTRADAAEHARSAYRELSRRAQGAERTTVEELLATDDKVLFGELLRGILASIIVKPGRGSLSERVEMVVLGASSAVDAQAPAREELSA